MGDRADGPGLVVIFLYGTLRHPPLLRAVLGRAPTLVPARAPGWRVCAVAGEPFPLLLPAAGAVAEGDLIEPQGDDLARMDFYEREFGYSLCPIAVDTPQGRVGARAYLDRSGRRTEAGPWSLESFAAARGALNAAAAAQFLSLWPAVPPAEAAARYPQIVQRAASRLRAQGEGAPRGPREGTGEVRVLAERHPYRAFFEVAEADLEFRRFDGGWSGPVTRAAFVMADAVTVLPYDPVRDRVLLVEQFRFGPMARGDRLPWTLEPIAGRIDGDEPPEACARREALEEAGVRLGRMIPAGRYYPSPGAVSEYIWSFIGLADLPDDMARHGGLAEEHEDIRVHLLPFGTALRLADEGGIETGPLILTILHLARLRPGLRDAARPRAEGEDRG